MLQISTQLATLYVRLQGKAACAGTASGFLLGKFCANDGVNCEDPHPRPPPAGYHCQGHILWLIVTLLTCMSPFGILLFRVGPNTQSPWQLALPYKPLA